MKRIYLLTILSAAIISGSSLLLSHSTGPRAAVSGSPLEGGNNCTICHSGTVNSGSGSLIVQGPETYTPGETYTISVQVNDEEQSRFGFQAIALNPSNDESGMLVTGTGTKIFSQQGVEYIEHSLDNSTGSFSFEWTAPQSGEGEVTFYVAGNAANGNNSTSGDHIYTETLAIADGTVGFEDGVSAGLKLYPNPSNGRFSVELGDKRFDQLQLFNLNGQLVKSFQRPGGTITIDGLEKGLYLLKARNSEEEFSQKVVIH